MLRLGQFSLLVFFCFNLSWRWLLKAANGKQNSLRLTVEAIRELLCAGAGRARWASVLTPMLGLSLFCIQHVYFVVLGSAKKSLKLAQRSSLSVLVQPLSGQQCLTMVFLYLLKAGVWYRRQRGSAEVCVRDAEGPFTCLIVPLLQGTYLSAPKSLLLQEEMVAGCWWTMLKILNLSCSLDWWSFCEAAILNRNGVCHVLPLNRGWLVWGGKKKKALPSLTLGCHH